MNLNDFLQKNVCKCRSARSEWKYGRSTTATKIHLFHVRNAIKFDENCINIQLKYWYWLFYKFYKLQNRLTTKIPRFNEIWSFIRQNMRPWSEFFAFNNFKTVPNFQRLSSRFLRNCNYFIINYLMVSFVLILYCL